MGMGECFDNTAEHFLSYPTAAFLTPHLQDSSQCGSRKTYLLEWLTCHMQPVQILGSNDKTCLPSALSPSCHLSVSFIHLKSLPFSLERPVVLKVQKPAFIRSGSCTINITITRKCSRRAAKLQVNGFLSRNLALFALH